MKSLLMRLRLALNILHGRPTVAFVPLLAPLQVAPCSNLMVAGVNAA